MTRMEEDPIRLAGRFPGLDFPGLFEVDGLRRLDEAFLERLGREDADLRRRLLELREERNSPPALEYSEWLLAAAPHLEAFVAGLFGIEGELARSEERRVGKECRSRWSPYH